MLISSRDPISGWLISMEKVVHFWWAVSQLAKDPFGVLRTHQLCTDAAHVHSPTGGQGMNTGVQDSVSYVLQIQLAAH